MLDLLSLVYMAVFIFSGFCISRLILPKDRFLKQLMFGVTAGLVMLLWLPVLFAFIMNFTLAAQLLAAAVAAGAAVFCLIKGKDRAKTGGFDKKKDIPLLLTCVPLIFIGIVLMSNHYIMNASNGSLHVGQCTYGDLCMHLGFITSISVQQTFPPMYSILPGTPLGYPFLCDSISSTFYTLGASLRWATLLPAVLAYVNVVLGVYLLFEDWFKRSSVAVLGTLLFFIGGGFGFWYFFDNSQTLSNLTTAEKWSDWLNETLNINATVTNPHPLDMGKLLMDGWYKTPTNFVDNGLRWVNSIADMMIPQRATLFGWSLLFPALHLLRRAVFNKENRLFIFLGVIAGAMPLVHTHSFFALGIISAFLLAAVAIMNITGRGVVTVDEKGRKLDTKKIKDQKDENRKHIGHFLLFGVIAVVLAAPQLLFFTFKQSSAEGFLRVSLNWCNESDSWLWFYIKNLGFIFLLMAPAFFTAKKETRLFYGGTLIIWAMCEFIVFQPNTYDNNKLLFVWFALTCGIVAEFILNTWRRLSHKGELPDEEDPDKSATPEKQPLMRRIGYGLLFGGLIGSMMISGVMTLAREYVSGDHIDFENNMEFKESGYEVVSAPLKEATDWIIENTEPDATFLTATNHNNAVAMLTGRNIVCGSTSFLYYHGLDYSERYNNARRMYESPDECFYALAEEYDVDYVLLSSWETYNYSVDRDFFDGLETVYQNDGVRICKVR